MITERRTVSKTVTTHLATLEEQTDAAMSTLAALIAAGIAGRRSAHLPLDAGQAGLDKLIEALGGLNAARRAVHEAHYALRDTRDTLRIPVTAYGDTGDTPAPEEKFARGAGLTVVQAAA